MNLQEYQTYKEQHVLQKVEKYIQKRYKSGEHFLCWFDVYTVDLKKDRCSKRCPYKAEVDRNGFVTLLTVLLKHPDITFSELPRYIPEELYVDILSWLRFPTTRHSFHSNNLGARSNPIAVEMVSLQEEVQSIAGDEPYYFSLHMFTWEHKSVSYSVMIWMRMMEIKVSYDQGENSCEEIYGMINVETVKKHLRVKTYRGLEGSLRRMNEKHFEAGTDAFWLIHWLENNRIKNVYATEERPAKG